MQLFLEYVKQRRTEIILFFLFFIIFFISFLLYKLQTAFEALLAEHAFCMLFVYQKTELQHRKKHKDIKDK